jgi:hypothetical protein
MTKYNMQGLKADRLAILKEKRWAKQQGLLKQWQELTAAFRRAVEEGKDAKDKR